MCTELASQLGCDYVVFEFTFRGLEVWQNKIAAQKQALKERLWA